MWAQCRPPALGQGLLPAFQVKQRGCPHGDPPRGQLLRGHMQVDLALSHDVWVDGALIVTAHRHSW